MAYNSTSYLTIPTASCLQLYNDTWDISIAFLNKFALAKFYSTANCGNESLLGYYVVNTAVNYWSNVYNVMGGTLSSLYICPNTTAC